MNDDENVRINKCPYCLSYNLIWLKKIDTPEGQLYRCSNCKKKVFIYD